MLTAKEAEILAFLAKGYEQKEIAIEFHVSRSAIRNQISRATQKLGARNSTHAIALALKKGVISFPEDPPDFLGQKDHA